MLEEIVITPEMVSEYNKLSERPEGKGLLEACSESVIVFAKHMLGMELYTWQKIVAIELMKRVGQADFDKRFAILTSRQIGKTTLSAILALWIATFNKTASGAQYNSKIGIVSATDNQAKKVLREVRTLLRIGDAHCREHYSKEKEDIMDKGLLSALVDHEEDNNKQTITFKYSKVVVDHESGAEAPEFGQYLLEGSKVGSRIDSFPPTAVILGNTFSFLYMDECGRSEKFTDEVHDEFLRPTVKAFDGASLYTSTPWQPSGFFYDLCDPEDKKEEHDYPRFLFTVDAIKYENATQYESCLKDIEIYRLDGKGDEAERAYYCRFVRGESSYFDPEDVDVMFDGEDKFVTEFDGAVDIGVDFGGQVKSRTVVTVTYLDSAGVIHRLYHKVYSVGDDDKLMDDLGYVMLRFPGWQRIIPDDCPAGHFRIKEMYKNGWNVHPMNFRTWKVKKFGAFRARLHRGLIKSYQDGDLSVEMKALEFSNAATQSNIMPPRGYNDDMIDSFVMSCFFYLEGEGETKIFTKRGQLK